MFSTFRAGAVLSALLGLFLVMAGRVAYLQTYGREKTINRADRQQHEYRVLPARPGDIFDRNGNVLAGTIETKTLFVDPKFMQDFYQQPGHSLVEMDVALANLGKLIDKTPYQLAQLLGDRPDSRFIKLAYDLDDPTIAAIEKLNLPGVGIVPAFVRSYPMGSLAAHVLGGTGADGVGLDGLELKYHNLLVGKDGYEKETKNARRQPIGVDADNYMAPQPGQHLVISIDANIQLMAEQELEETILHMRGKRGEVVVMDCYNGDVLALANYPTFNPQMVGEALPDVRRNSALVAPYEPGSTGKPFFTSAALMQHITTPWEMWTIPGIVWHTPYGRAVTDVHHYGNLCTWDGLVKSSNILMSMLGERMGNTRLYNALTSFGFGHKTGIDLPGENAGKVSPLNKWTHYSPESIAQGYEYMVTPLQICRAFCAIANGGRLVTPRLVLSTLDANGKVISRQKDPDFDQLPVVIDEETSQTMRRILADVVIRGTAKGYRSRVYNIPGKTGTAHIAEGHGYSQTKFNASFISCAPYEHPRIVVAFIIHEPDREIAHYGGAVAAPGACRLIDRALSYLDVPASPDLPLPPAQVQHVLWEYNPKAYTDRGMGSGLLYPRPAVADAQH